MGAVMRKERKQEYKSKKATTGLSAQNIVDIFAVIESKPVDEVTLFQRSKERKAENQPQFQRQNRIEVATFGLIQGRGARAHYPIRFINKHQLDVARSLRPGSRIKILLGEFSYRAGRRQTEVHIRDFVVCDSSRVVRSLRAPELLLTFHGTTYQFWLAAA